MPPRNAAARFKPDGGFQPVTPAPDAPQEQAAPSSSGEPRTIPIAKVQFMGDAIPAIPGIGSMTVLVSNEQKAKERNPSGVTRAVGLVYNLDDQLLSVRSKEKDGTECVTLVPFGAIKAMQVEQDA